MDTLRGIISGLVIALLVLLALALAAYGTMKLTQATEGVGAIALAIFVAILARLTQAADHHADILRHLERKFPDK